MLKAIMQKSTKNIVYPIIPSAITLVAHDNALPVLTPPPHIEETVVHSSSDPESDEYYPSDDSTSTTINQLELGNL